MGGVEYLLGVLVWPIDVSASFFLSAVIMVLGWTKRRMVVRMVCSGDRREKHGREE